MLLLCSVPGMRSRRDAGLASGRLLISCWLPVKPGLVAHVRLGLWSGQQRDLERPGVCGLLSLGSIIVV